MCVSDLFLGELSLSFINDNCYGVCIRAGIRRLVRELLKTVNNKSTAWRTAVYLNLRRLRDHLVSRRFIPIVEIYADNEFVHFQQELDEVFETKNIHIGKTQYIVFPDVLAYTNMKLRRYIKKFRNIKEL